MNGDEGAASPAEEPRYDDPVPGSTDSGYDADDAWTVRKEPVGPGWVTQAGAGSGPGWGSAPTYESDATPFGTGYGESARYEAESVEAAESAPADPDADTDEPDYTDDFVEDLGALADDPSDTGDDSSEAAPVD